MPSSGSHPATDGAAQPTPPTSPFTSLLRRMSSKSRRSSGKHSRQSSANSVGGGPSKPSSGSSKSSAVFGDVKREAASFISATLRDSSGRRSLDETRRTTGPPSPPPKSSGSTKKRPLSVGSLIPAPSTSPKLSPGRTPSPNPSFDTMRITLPSPPPSIVSSPTSSSKSSQIPVLVKSSPGLPPLAQVAPLSPPPSPPTPPGQLELAPEPTLVRRSTVESLNAPQGDAGADRGSSPSPTPSLTSALKTSSVLKRRGTDASTASRESKNVRFNQVVSSIAGAGNGELAVLTNGRRRESPNGSGSSDEEDYGRVIDTPSRSFYYSTSSTTTTTTALKGVMRTNFIGASASSTSSGSYIFWPTPSPNTALPNANFISNPRSSHSPSSSTTSATLVSGPNSPVLYYSEADYQLAYEKMKRREIQPVWEALLEVVLTVFVAGLLVVVALFWILWDKVRETEEARKRFEIVEDEQKSKGKGKAIEQ